MTIMSFFHLVKPALHTLGVDSLPGLQLYEAAAVAALHHPPLNPDCPALLVVGQRLEPEILRKALLNQYPEEHPISVLYSGVDEITAEEFRLEKVTCGSLANAHEEYGPGTLLYVPPLAQGSSFERFQETIAHLRAPEGCPWDQKQTHSSLRPYLLEETYEVLDALDAGDIDALCEELGDLLLQIVLHSQIAVEKGEFRMPDIVAAINEKIIRRHPHVWGSVEVNGEQDVKVNWDRLKKAEKGEERRSRLDGVPRSLPALSQAYSYQDRAARVGFDWDAVAPVIDKVYEEITELLEAGDDKARGAEAGDVLFAVVNLARWLHVDPESALRDANRRFYRRFAYIEEQVAAQNRDLEAMSLAEMDVLWDDAKAKGL